MPLKDGCCVSDTQSSIQNAQAASKVNQYHPETHDCQPWHVVMTWHPDSDYDPQQFQDLWSLIGSDVKPLEEDQPADLHIALLAGSGPKFENPLTSAALRYERRGPWARREGMLRSKGVALRVTAHNLLMRHYNPSAELSIDDWQWQKWSCLWSRSLFRFLYSDV